MAGSDDLSLALHFCDGLRQWAELPREMSVSADHVDMPKFVPPAEWPGDDELTTKLSLKEGLRLGLFPLKRVQNGSSTDVIRCVAGKDIKGLIEEHGKKALVKFLHPIAPTITSASLLEQVEVIPEKAMVCVQFMTHQIEMLDIFASHAKEIEDEQAAAATDLDLTKWLNHDKSLAKIRKKNVNRWMRHVIRHGTTEACIEMLRAFSRLADKPLLLSRCVAGAEDLACHLRPPIDAALTLRSYFMGCGTRRSMPSKSSAKGCPPDSPATAAFLKDLNRFMTFCQELKTRLERQRGDMEGQIENLIDKGKTYCLFGGSQLALRVMTRLRQKVEFDLFIIENEVKEIKMARQDDPDLPADQEKLRREQAEREKYGWKKIRLSQLDQLPAKQKKALARTPALFAGVCCAVPEGAYVEAGLRRAIETLREHSKLTINRKNGSHQPPQLALVLGGHKFVRGQIGTPAFYTPKVLKPFHEFLSFDNVRYLVS